MLMSRDHVITQAAMFATMALVTYLVLPVAFIGKAKAPQGGIDIAGRTTVVDLLGICEGPPPFYVRLAVTLARCTGVRLAIFLATMAVTVTSAVMRGPSGALRALYAVLMWTMILALWLQTIAIFMCVG